MQTFREEVAKPFALLRVVTTPAHFGDFVGAVPVPGDWFRLEIAPDGKGLRSWHAQLTENGYSALSRGIITSARRLGTSDDSAGRPGPHPQALGAAASPTVLLPTALIGACTALPQPASSGAISTILNSVPQVSSVLVRDVGQASFVSLRDAHGRAVLHYDVGYPIAFNGHTAPRGFDVDDSESPPIILSHWDWDHLHAAYRKPHLLNCQWIVPDQRLGPGAARLARILAAKGNLLVRPAIARGQFKFGEVTQSQGLAGDLNNTGLTILVALANGRSALLTGDADYADLRHAAARRVDHLVATHHGARFGAPAASVPTPSTEDCALVISYGSRNVYRHPHPESLAKHATAGWTSLVTTAGRRGVSGRGDCIMA